MPRRLTAAGLAVAVVAIVALAAGCGSFGHAAAQTDALEKQNLTVAAVPVVDAAGFFVALQQGLFAAQGLRIRYVPVVSSTTVIAAQEAGDYDITFGNYVSYIQAVAQGHAAGLRIIAEGSVMQPRTQSIYVLPGSPVTAIPQLKGRRVAINALGNVNYLLAVSVLADYGIPAADVGFVPVPFSDMGQALKSGEVAAAVIPEPFASEYTESIGLTTLADTDQGATQNLPIAGYVATRAWARKYPLTLAAFTRALDQGQEIADTNMAVVQTAIEHFVGVSRLTATVMTLDSYPLSIDPIQLQQVPEAMYQFGLLKKPFNIGSMLG